MALEGLDLDHALREVREALGLHGFSAFDRDDPESRHSAAGKTVLLSMSRLSEGERALYSQLSVFPEDEAIPFSVLEPFLGLDCLSLQRFCRRLHELSLLRQLDLQNKTIRLHDVIRSVLIEQIEGSLPTLHSQLLDSLRPVSGTAKNNGGAVKFEIEMASARRIAGEKIRIIGLYREGQGAPAHLRDRRYADFRDDLRYEENFKALLNDLLGMTDKPPLGGGH